MSTQSAPCRTGGQHLRDLTRCQTSTMKTRGLICIITGASDGFGRVLVHQVVHLMKAGSILLLVAHSGTLLQELKEDLQSFTEEQHPQIRCIIADLSTKDGVEEIVTRARQEAVNKLDHGLLINNAASLGDNSRIASFTDITEVNSYLSLNVSSALALTAGILQLFPCRPGL